MEAAADLLAGVVADPPADAGQRVGFSYQIDGFLVFPYPDHSHIAGNILMDGAGNLAGGELGLLDDEDVGHRLGRRAVDGVPIGKSAVKVAGNFYGANLRAFVAGGAFVKVYIAGFFKIVNPKIPFLPFNFGYLTKG